MEDNPHAEPLGSLTKLRLLIRQKLSPLLWFRHYHFERPWYHPQQPRQELAAPSDVAASLCPLRHGTPGSDKSVGGQSQAQERATDREAAAALCCELQSLTTLHPSPRCPTTSPPPAASRISCGPHIPPKPALWPLGSCTPAPKLRNTSTFATRRRCSATFRN